MREGNPFFQGAADGPWLATSGDQSWTNQITREGLRRAGITLMLGTLWYPVDLRPGQTSRDEAVLQVRKLRRFAQTTPGYAVARDAAHARGLLQRDVIVVLPHLEGAEAIAQVEDVDVLFSAGYRSIGLVHFTDNEMAGAHADQFGPHVARLLGEGGGLTPFGRKAIERMIQLGLLIDVGHASARTKDEVLELTEAAGVPIIDSHAGADWQVPHTLSAEHAHRIAARGGLIGVGIYRHDLLMPVPEAERWPGFADGTCDEIVAQWRYYAEIAGPERVMLGSDLNSVIFRARPGGACPHGLRHAGDLPALFQALETHGIPADALDGTADRLLQVIEQVERRADPMARQQAQRRALAVPGPFDAPL